VRTHRIRAGATVLGLIFLGGTATAAPSKAACIAASEKAQDQRQTGKLREARLQLAVCVATSCPGPVREDCARLLAEVDSVMPSLVFEVKDRAGEDLTGVRVTVDGELLTDKLDGTAIVVNPGEHRFVFEADGMPTAEKSLVVREGDKGRHVRVRMESGTAAAAPAPEAAPPPTAPSAPPRAKDAPGSDSSSDGGSTQRATGLVLGAVGIAGLAVGGIFGVLTKTTYQNALQNECGNNPSTCTTQGSQDGKTAHTDATISTASFIAGAALVAAGSVIYLSAPKQGIKVSPAVGMGGAVGLHMVGQW
jgi:hypothetical protein